MRKATKTRGDAGEKQLAEFMAKYEPEIAGLARLGLTKLRKRLPGAVELVYDYYNALSATAKGVSLS